ncbi:MAG: cytochrome c4 [Gammaproteobacteria bacterium]|nr:cytochrome c4 [Gammaproteobacteria bacterium]MBT8111223.1 cytochrome c4 [Gammaproteobacteria bacterium]NND46181.1 cytochrome c4 [Woeseiaceae bacterium]NNL45921.1 cytochrome c4 [Woeseiaceae bacterium]
MKNKLVLIFAAAALIVAAVPAQAASLVDGSAEAGKAKALTCSACHGAEGNSSNALWPNIAGQNAPYILAQLMAYKDGSRKNPLMSSQAMLLSAEDMADLAVYFESLPAAAQSVADADLVARGEALFRGGDAANGTAACMACHGPTGRGNPAAKYPALNGQHAAYTAKQLQDYAAGTRETDGKTRMMREIAARLDREDIEAVASYVQGLK